MKAYEEGTMLLLGDVVALIGCGSAMPADHKNEWLQNRFSLKPAGRMRLPGRKDTHLVWRERDVQKAKKLWEGRSLGAAEVQRPGILVDLGRDVVPLSKKAELAAIERETAGWKSVDAASPRALLETAGLLTRLALEGLAKAGVA